MLNTLTSRGGLAATTALVAVGFLIVTPQMRELLTPGGGADLGAARATCCCAQLASQVDAT